MSVQEGTVIQHAVEAIGKAATEDYVVTPTSHAAELASRAPAMAAILETAEVGVAAAQYQEADQEALEAQRKFRLAVGQSNWCVFLAACFGALVLAVGALRLPDPIGKGLFIAFVVASIVAGGWAAARLSQIRQGRLLEAWMTARATAEARRLQYFQLVTKPPATSLSEADVPLALLQLEYFRRFQLGVQLAFYHRRGEDHERAANRALALGTFAVFVASVATALAGVLGALSSRWSAIATLGVAGSSLSFFAGIREATSQDRRNAERYQRTYETLQGLEAQLDRVRRAVAGGAREALDQYVAAVQDQLSLEHRQWLKEAGEIGTAASQLSQTLRSLEAERARLSPGG